MAGVEEYQNKLKAMGLEIRARRESLGLSLDEVTDKTKLRAKYLAAVEAGDESQAPGATYFKAFLKTYATFLGLDGLAYSQAYQAAVEERDAPPVRGKPRPAQIVQQSPAAAPQATAPPAAPPVLHETLPPSAPAARVRTEDTPVPEVQVSRSAAPVRQEVPAHRPPRRPRRSSHPFLWAFLTLFVVAAGAYVAVTWENKPTTTEPPVSTTPPTNTEPPVVTPPVVEPPAPKVTRTDPNKEATVFSVDRTPVELVIRTDKAEDAFCWIRVDVDGETAFEKTLSPGQEEKVSAKTEIVVRAGKPWVVTFIVNGQDQGKGGEFGPVKDITVRSTP